MSQAGLYERDIGFYGRIRRRAAPPFNPAVLHQTIRPMTEYPAARYGLEGRSMN
jgi:hypothetical protein